MWKNTKYIYREQYRSTELAGSKYSISEDIERAKSNYTPVPNACFAGIVNLLDAIMMKI